MTLLGYLIDYSLPQRFSLRSCYSLLDSNNYDSTRETLRIALQTWHMKTRADKRPSRFAPKASV